MPMSDTSHVFSLPNGAPCFSCPSFLPQLTAPNPLLLYGSLQIHVCGMCPRCSASWRRCVAPPPHPTPSLFPHTRCSRSRSLSARSNAHISFPPVQIFFLIISRAPSFVHNSLCVCVCGPVCMPSPLSSPFPSLLCGCVLLAWWMSLLALLSPCACCFPLPRSLLDMHTASLHSCRAPSSSLSSSTSSHPSFIQANSPRRKELFRVHGSAQARIACSADRSLPGWTLCVCLLLFCLGGGI